MAVIDGVEFPGVEVRRYDEADLHVVVLLDEAEPVLRERFFAIVRLGSQGWVHIDRGDVIRLARLLLTAEEIIAASEAAELTRD